MIMRQIQNSGKISEDVRSGAPLLPVKGWHHFYWKEFFCLILTSNAAWGLLCILIAPFIPQVKPYIEDLGRADSDSDSDDEDKDKTEWSALKRTWFERFALRLWLCSLPNGCWSSLFMRFMFRRSSWYFQCTRGWVSHFDDQAYACPFLQN
jgi:hypothetical protein